MRAMSMSSLQRVDQSRRPDVQGHPLLDHELSHHCPSATYAQAGRICPWDGAATPVSTSRPHLSSIHREVDGPGPGCDARRSGSLPSRRYGPRGGAAQPAFTPINDVWWACRAGSLSNRGRSTAVRSTPTVVEAARECALLARARAVAAFVGGGRPVTAKAVLRRTDSPAEAAGARHGRRSRVVSAQVSPRTHTRVSDRRMCNKQHGSCGEAADQRRGGSPPSRTRASPRRPVAALLVVARDVARHL